MIRFPLFRSAGLILILWAAGAALHAKDSLDVKLDFLVPPIAETSGAGFRQALDVPYKEGEGLTAYEKERCKLDIFLPSDTGGKAAPVVVWFHGGGLTGGDKTSDRTRTVVQDWARSGTAVVCVNYRLSPKTAFPAYVQDGAAAVAWVVKRAGLLGCDARRIFIGGHSAGAYLALMLGLDAQYLKAAGVELGTIAGLIPVSGQTMTHFTVRVERGLPKDTIVADAAAAPVSLVRKEAPPMLLLVGGQDMATRLEENQYFAALMTAKGHRKTWLVVVPERTHGTIFTELGKGNDPGRKVLESFITDPQAFQPSPEQ